MTDGAVVGADRRRATIARPVVLFERGLGIEGVDLAGPSIHEQENNMFGPGRKVGRPGRRQVWLTARSRSAVSLGCLRTSREEA